MIRSRNICVRSIASLESQVKINFCKDCKFFIKPIFTSFNNAKCKKNVLVNEVSGEVMYGYVELFRKYSCKGDMFERQKRWFDY